MRIVMIHDLMESNGKTIRENNLEKQHTIALFSGTVNATCKAIAAAIRQ